MAKGLTAYPALRIARAVPKTAARAALSLANVGEFSFVLALAGGKLGLLAGEGQQLFVAVAVVTILLVPFVIAAGPALAARLPDVATDGEPVTSELRRGHVVVVGYGLNGSNVARVLGETGLKTVVVEADADRGRQRAARRRAGPPRRRDGRRGAPDGGRRAGAGRRRDDPRPGGEPEGRAALPLAQRRTCGSS